jgi:hypothetical protein
VNGTILYIVVIVVTGYVSWKLKGDILFYTTIFYFFSLCSESTILIGPFISSFFLLLENHDNVLKSCSFFFEILETNSPPVSGQFAQLFGHGYSILLVRELLLDLDRTCSVTW